ncbi:MAG: cysteine--tRNA ligase [Desulfobacterales bacterium]|nr:cysteine--tRNA ligase [Desulfobacterales bacterium]
MAIRIYNTLTKQKEIFEPIIPGKVGMYVCGPTVYDSCHIGHARALVVFDVIVNYLRATGYDVTYIRNFTDIDDKIIDRANQLQVSSREIAEKYIAEFYEDMDAIYVSRANVEPKATDHIQSIIQIIEQLIHKGMAYHEDGDVFYSVSAFSDYGKLSGRKLEEMEAGARVDINPKKKNPLDFALWKAAKPDEPSWDSPWGKGRPGWHIECSAMSRQYLGDTIDIHGGGKDLIFPHHENEIAQSEGAFGKCFVRYWIHNGFININHEKMSKSLGNFKTIKDVLKTYHPEVLRLFLISSHYRSPIDFSDKSMDDAKSVLERLYALCKRCLEHKISIHGSGDMSSSEYWPRFCEAMDDDFNTAIGISVLFDAMHHANRIMDQSVNILQDENKPVLLSIFEDIFRMSRILGILNEDPLTFFEKQKSKALAQQQVDVSMIEQMIQERALARKQRDFAKADQIRQKLQSINIILEDKPDGTIWKVR